MPAFVSPGALHLLNENHPESADARRRAEDQARGSPSLNHQKTRTRRLPGQAVGNRSYRVLRLYPGQPLLSQERPIECVHPARKNILNELIVKFWHH